MNELNYFKSFIHISSLSSYNNLCSRYYDHSDFTYWENEVQKINLVKTSQMTSVEI